jgi:hypothetical protein
MDMKRITSYSLLCLFTLISLSVWAQTKKGEDKKAAKPKIVYIPVYLGNSNISGGAIPKRMFDSLLKQGLTSRDSAGRKYNVNGFIFNYGERVLYEDSIGNPLIVTDNLEEYCYGDSLTTFLKNNISERSKPGDTAYFDRINVIAPEGNPGNGGPMKFVITK